MPENAASPALISEAVTGPQGLGIRSKLAMTIGGLVTLALALLAAFALRESRNALLQEATRRGLIIGRNLADYSASAVLQKDPLQAFQFTKDALNDEAMVHALLTDENGAILAIRAASGNPPAQTGAIWQPLTGKPLRMDGLPPTVQVVESKDPESGDPVLAFAFPVIKAEVQVGNAYIALSQAKIQRVVRETTLKVIILSIGFVVLALIAAFMVSNLIVRPVRRLTQGALAVGSGDLGASVSVESRDELGVLARSFNAMTAGLKRAQQEMLDKQMLMQELNIAQEIQQGLLPKKIPQVAGYELAAYYAPAKEVGGDLYDFIRISEERLAVAVADVSGKSVPGSLGMTMARSVLRSQTLVPQSVGQTLHKTNEVIQPDIRRGMFVTMFYAVLNARDHKLEVANAGHNPAFQVKSGGQVEEIGPEGIALGLVPAAQFFVDELTVGIDPGDLIAFYTDGVTEAMNAASEEYGDDRFKAALVKARQLPLGEALQSVLNDVKAFVAGAPPHDDITLVLLRRKAA
jgi:sigma-B regulation protein RsbU (phosphoserine phosphatase)